MSEACPNCGSVDTISKYSRHETNTEFDEHACRNRNCRIVLFRVGDEVGGDSP